MAALYKFTYLPNSVFVFSIANDWSLAEEMQFAVRVNKQDCEYCK